jgi:drug/metabolite transporter (DMT)-like permease
MNKVTSLPFISKENKHQLINWLIVAALALTWGSSFILIKRSLVGLQFIQVACLRISVTMVVLLPFTLFHIRKIPIKKIPILTLSGLLGSGIPAFLFASAQQHLDSSVAGVLNALTPVWALVLGIVIFKIPTTLTQILGILLGFAGAVSLILSKGVTLDREHIQYIVYLLIATACYGANLNILRKYLQDLEPVQIASVAFFIIGIPALIILFNTDFVSRIATMPEARTSLMYVSLLGLLGTAAASIVFYILIQRTSTLFGAITTYFIPVVAVAWGVIDSEPISYVHAIGLLLILAGVYLATRK